MTRTARARTVALALAVCALVGCGSAATPPPSQLAESATQTVESPSASQPARSASGSPTAGFAFTADDVEAYYESQGYACGTPKPSPKAGYAVRTCTVADDAGRTRVIALTTDGSGALGNGSASVTGTPSETMLEPIKALDPLAGFLGATLGEQQGSAMLTWLASHLGDANAETTSGALTVTTHTAGKGDHATLFVEVSSEAYLAASP